MDKLFQQKKKRTQFLIIVFVILLIILFFYAISKNNTSHAIEVSYDDCGRGKYYVGHGPEVLKNPTSTSYLSANDISSSYICFKDDSKSKKNLKKIKFGWYSKKEIPQVIAIYGLIKKDKNQQEILLGEFSIQQVNTENNGKLFSTIDLNANQPFDSYLIKVIKGGYQERLILRSLVPQFD